MCHEMIERLTAEQAKLAEENFPLCYHYTTDAIRKGKDLRKYRLDRDDMLEIAFEGLIKAVKTFNPDSGAAFSTYFWKVCTNVFRHEVQLMKCKKRRTNTLSLSFEDPAPGIEKLKLGDSIADDGETVEECAIRMDTARIIREEVFKLPETLKEAMILYYFKEYSVGEIAAKLGTHPHTVTNRTTQARKILRQRLTERGCKP